VLKTDLQRLVESNCATYDSEGKCLLETSPGCRQCPLFIDGDGFGRCPYFENAVLPADDRLKARYWQAFGLAFWSDAKGAKNCAVCGNLFEPKSNRQKYCANCGDEVKRRQRSRQNREYYQKNKGSIQYR